MALKSVASLNKDKLEDIFEEVGNRADLSSNLIYVYSYTISKGVRKRIYSSQTPLNLVGAEQETAYSRFSGSKKDDIKGRKRIEAKDFKKNRYDERWAVRLESNLSPINKVFLTRKEALVYATKLKNNGKGDKVVIVD